MVSLWMRNTSHQKEKPPSKIIQWTPQQDSSLQCIPSVIFFGNLLSGTRPTNQVQSYISPRVLRNVLTSKPSGTWDEAEEAFTWYRVKKRKRWPNPPLCKHTYKSCIVAQSCSSQPNNLTGFQLLWLHIQLHHSGNNTPTFYMFRLVKR